MTQDTEVTPYERLGGYDGIVSVAGNFLHRVHEDPRLERFWETRSDEVLAAARQRMVLYLTAAAGGPALYLGRDIEKAHQGMGVTPEEWDIYMGYVKVALEEHGLSGAAFEEMYGFLQSHKAVVVEA